MARSKYAVPCLLLALSSSAWARSVEDDLRQFEDFKLTYGRTYSPSEDVHRFGCFRKVMDLVDVRNAHGAETHGVNQFSDLCPEEFAKMYLGYKASNATKKVESVSEVVMAGQKINWNDKGAVTPIKNQGQCGSCWSFSATGNMEGQWMLAGNTLIGLSEEELVQCSHNGDMGCRGGLMDDAFQWVINNGGINSESNYPYTSGFGVTGTCKQSKTTTHVAKISGFTNLPNNEDQMATWCFSNGPISIAVDALSWQTYSGGIMSNCFGTQLDHGVLIVGFDDTFSTPYWIVKNSWGSSWGENGFIRLAKGSNQCGLKNDPSSSKVSNDPSSSKV